MGRATAICLNQGFQADLAQWREFVGLWNGIGFVTQEKETEALLEVTSDASGSWGCGAWHACHWFQAAWDPQSQDLDIACKELIPIFLACAI